MSKIEKHIMTLRIGDRVRFLNDVGGGIVTAFIDEKMVEVKTDDGFELPVLASELLREASSNTRNSDDNSYSGSGVSKTVISEEEFTIKTEDFRYVKFKGEAFLAIIPENEKLLHVSDFKLYLINDSNYSIHYVLAQTEGKVFEFIKAGTLEPETKMTIKQYGQAGLSKIKALRLQAFYSKEGLHDPQPALDVTSNLEGISFYKASEFKDNPYFNSKAIVFKHEELDMEEAVRKLSESDILKVKQAKDSKPIKVEKIANSDIEEVDLHIEQIVDNHSGMSNGEIVDVQLSRFETALETAIKSNTKKIVFIHGIGNGKLKHELRSKLDRKYSQFVYQDASFKEYGFGATMVNLK